MSRYFKLTSGCRIYFNNPITENLEAITKDTQWLEAFKVRYTCAIADTAYHLTHSPACATPQIWKRTAGPRRLAAMRTRLEALGKLLSHGLIELPHDSDTDPEDEAPDIPTVEDLYDPSSVTIVDESEAQAADSDNEATGDAAGDAATAAPAVDLPPRVPTPQPRPMVGDADNRPRTSTLRAHRRRRSMEHGIGTAEARRSSLVTQELPISSGEESLTEAEWLTQVWETLDELHGYAHYSRLHPFILSDCMDGLHKCLSRCAGVHAEASGPSGTIDGAHMPPGVALSAAHLMWTLLSGGNAQTASADGDSRAASDRPPPKQDAGTNLMQLALVKVHVVKQWGCC